jgi:DNA-binding CsgD family transcriptional regulator
MAEVLRVAALIVGADPPGDAAVRRRAEHDVEIAVEALRRLAIRVAGTVAPAFAGGRPRRVSLSTRERRVVDLLVANKTYKDIACDMGISVLSAQSRVKNVYMKLAVHSKAELRALLQQSALAGTPEHGADSMATHEYPSRAAFLEASWNQR